MPVDPNRMGGGRLVQPTEREWIQWIGVRLSIPFRTCGGAWAESRSAPILHADGSQAVGFGSDRQQLTVPTRDIPAVIE